MEAGRQWVKCGAETSPAAVQVVQKKRQWERKQREDEEERKETDFYQALELNHEREDFILRLGLEVDFNQA